MTRQLRLSLDRPPAPTRESFVRGPSNAAAIDAIDAWPGWHGGCLVLVGPTGVGKSHLAHAWADLTGAIEMARATPDIAAAAGRPVLLEDADRGVDDEALFHLINLAGRDGGGLLMTARVVPSAWSCALPDLRSRLNALPVAEVEDPDDDVLRGVIEVFFRNRNIRPPEDIYPYLLQRMSRSIPDAQEIVRRLDEAGDHQFRRISRLLAREILEGQTQILDLSEG